MAEHQPAKVSGQLKNISSLEDAFATGLTAKLLSAGKSTGQMIEYDSMDFKKSVNHDGLARYEHLLECILVALPSGVVSQRPMLEAMQTVTKPMQINEQIVEMAVFKIRVMLAHVRLISVRNLPKHLKEETAAACKRLVAMVESSPSPTNTKATTPAAADKANRGI